MENLKPTVKLGRGHIMIWESVYFNGIGEMVFVEGSMITEIFIDTL